MAGFSSAPFSKKGDKTPCEKIVIQTQLISPQEEVIKTLHKGDILVLVLLKRNGPCVAMYQEKIAGTIINKDIVRLIECMKMKKEFIAVIRSIAGGRCAITIKISTAI